MAANVLLEAQRHPHEIKGHPSIIIPSGGGPKLVTLCASCGQMKTILFLDRDRWFCMRCKTEGAAAPALYPIA